MDEIKEIKKELEELKIQVKRLEQELNFKRPEFTLHSPEINQCIEMWKATLEKFEIERPVLSHELFKIGNLIRTHGYKSVLYAFYGARFEEGSAGFKPENNVSIDRLYDEKIFNKLLNLGARVRTKEKKRQKEMLQQIDRGKNS